MILKEADKSGLLRRVDIERLALYLWSVIHGATYVSHSIVFHPNTEMTYLGKQKDFQKFVIDMLKEQLKTFIQ